MSADKDKQDLGATVINEEPKAEQPKQKTVLGDFELGKKLGQGGMGAVYLARQISLDRPVALKLLSKELAKKPGFVERFIREARSMAKLDHVNAVKAYAADTASGQHYVAIEFIDGSSMQKWMDQLGKLSIPDAVHIILRCADALRVAHDLNMIHRDIKPDNILLTKKGIVKVADFGLAKVIDDEDMSMTQSGTGLGTPLYMAPEQARDAKSTDKRTDIYALGVTFYYFVTGKLPFSGDSVVKLIMAKEAGKYDNARKLNREVPEKLDLIIDKMIQKDKNHRYPTCDEFIRDLEPLGLESPSLSFIEGGEALATRRTTAPAGTGTSSPKVNLSAIGKTSADVVLEAAEKMAAKDQVLWYVKHTNPKGQVVISKMTAVQIQQMIKGELLDLKATTRRGEKGDFQPLAQFSEFEDFVKKRLAKASAQTRGVSMKDMYAKIEREQKRRKIWRWFRGLFEGAMGGVGFIIYLALIVGGLIGAYKAFPIVADFVAKQFNLITGGETKPQENPLGKPPSNP